MAPAFFGAAFPIRAPIAVDAFTGTAATGSAFAPRYFFFGALIFVREPAKPDGI